MKPLEIYIETINAQLPQTQCGDCGYSGCKPYATAILENHENIDLCLPGGVEVLQKLGELLNQPVAHLEKDMQKRAKPKRLAFIRESECIGCTKCIQACPVDAIFGASKQMHTVIAAECTGCALCVEPCPMDCIDMLPTENQVYEPEHAKMRFEARNSRLENLAQKKREKHLKKTHAAELSRDEKLKAKKAAIQAALARKK